ncbi:hypothetical protein D9M69_658510 [compost metagenome]
MSLRERNLSITMMRGSLPACCNSSWYSARPGREFMILTTRRTSLRLRGKAASKARIAASGFLRLIQELQSKTERKV